MLQKISSRISFPEWAQDCRWRRLHIRDLLLEGRFYEHLPYAFYDEVVPGSDTMIPLADRRPSAQYRFARMVARWSGRKLWAGRHAPQVMHASEDAQKVIRPLLANAMLFPTMLDATIRGSVGSVAVTFRVDEVDGQDPQVKLNVWPARDCTPTFDRMGNLAALQVAYRTNGRAIKQIGDPPGMEISQGKLYWFVRRFDPEWETTFLPIESDDWNPETGFQRPNMQFVPWEGDDFTVQHNLGFVPGVWIRNLNGGCEPDGACTWEDAIGFSIEMDYLLSQASRGTRYNCAPELVVKGDLAGAQAQSEDGRLQMRSTASYIHLRAGVKDPDGVSFGDGDAKLLETSGAGTDSAIKFVAQLRNMALESISAARKDPEKLKAPLSGRAMEFLDEDSHDLVMELRSQYGEHGALVLIRKIVRAVFGGIDESKITLKWPRLYQATPDDLQALVPALVMAATPIVDPSTESQGGGGEGAPAPAPPKTLGAIVTVQEASDYFHGIADIDAWSGSQEPDPGNAPRPENGGSPGEPKPDDGDGDDSLQVLTETFRVRRRS